MDAFDYTDDILLSTIGGYDGNAYEVLYESIKQNPLNANKVNITCIFTYQKSYHMRYVYVKLS
jgi:hypothetical protein